MSKIDNPINRIFLIGLLGGLALIATLYVPLYRFVPSQIVPDWSEPNRFLVLLSTLASLAVMLSTGFAAARFGKGNARSINMAFGGIAGGVAGILSFFAIGAATAGIIGTHVIFDYGLVPATDDEHFIRLVIDSVVGSIWWGYGAFWISLIGGVGLGAFGAFSVAPSSDPMRISRSAVRGWVSMMLVITTLILVVQTSIFSLIEDNVSEQAIKYGISGNLLISNISVLPIATAGVCFLVLLAVLLFMQRADIRSQQPDRLLGAFMSGLIFSLFTPISMVFIGLVNQTTDPRQLFGSNILLMLLAVAFVLSLWLLYGCYQTRQQLLSFPKYRQFMAFNPTILLGIGVLLVILYLLPLPSLLALILGIGIAFLYGKQTIPYRLVTRSNVIIGLIMLLILAIISLTTALFIISLVTSFTVMLYRHKLPQRRDDRMVKLNLLDQLNMILGTIVMITFSICISTIASLSMVVITVAAIIPLAQYDPDVEAVTSQSTLTELAQNLYFAHAQALIIASIIAVALVGLITLIIFGVNWLVKRRSRHMLDLLPAT